MLRKKSFFSDITSIIIQEASLKLYAKDASTLIAYSCVCLGIAERTSSHRNADLTVYAICLRPNSVPSSLNPLYSNVQPVKDRLEAPAVPAPTARIPFHPASCHVVCPVTSGTVVKVTPVAESVPFVTVKLE